MSKKPQRVIRLARLPEFLGVQRSAIQAMIDKGLLHPFSPTNSRAMVVLESEVAELQERAQAAAKERRDAG